MVVFAQPAIGKTTFCLKNNSLGLIDSDDILIDLLQVKNIDEAILAFNKLSDKDKKLLTWQLNAKIARYNKEKKIIFTARPMYIPIAKYCFFHDSCETFFEKYLSRNRMMKSSKSQLKSKYLNEYQQAINLKKEIILISKTQNLSDYAHMFQQEPRAI